MALRTALITGAQQGIGASLAMALADVGVDVALNYFDNEKAAADVAKAITQRGRKAVLVPGDVSRASDVSKMVAQAHAGLGSIDILVNNAGIFPYTGLLDITEAEWDRVLNVNLKGAFLCTQAVVKLMIDAKKGGSIINMSSGALMGAPKGSHYAASKGGLSSLTKGLALELAPFGIRVNALAPGLIDTAQPRGNWSEDEITRVGQGVPMGRVGQVGDLNGIVQFLVGDGSDYITGQTIHINGGTMRM